MKNLVDILEFIRLKKLKTKVFYASSSEIFQNTKRNIFNENSRIEPRSPYGISKAALLALMKHYAIEEGPAKIRCNGTSI